MLGGAFSGFTERPPPSPSGAAEYLRLPGSSPELPLSADYQTFFGGPHFRYQSGRHYHFPFPHESPHSHHTAHLIQSDGISESISEPSSLSIGDVFHSGPISEHAYPAGMGTHISGVIQDSMAAIPGGSATTDSIAATALIDEYPSTPHQVLSGDVNGFAEVSMTDHGSHLPYSVRQNEGEALPNLQLAFQESYPEISVPSIAWNQDRHVEANSGRFRCRACGARFSQKQGLNRHKRDKHSRKMFCRICKKYIFSSGRRYLFIRHLEKQHPEFAFATNLADLAEWVPPAGKPSHTWSHT